MMQNETILALASESWDSLWRSTQQYLSRLAINNRVVYIEPGRRPDRSVWTEYLANVRNFFKLNIKRINENLILVTSPSILPYGRRVLPRPMLYFFVPFVSKINSTIKAWHVRRIMKVLDIHDPLLWLYSPDQKDLVGKFGEKISCYFNYDEFSIFEENERIKNIIIKYDNLLTKRVDLVFATSRSQWVQRQAINSHTYFLPNGVDFQLFNRALTKALPVPLDISCIPRPIIGYSGSVGSQIDITQLLKLADAYPMCSLVLIGPDDIPGSKTEKALRARQNVYFLGRKERTQLPNYLQIFDVALIPYKLSGYVLSAYPLKIHEYLAAGRAVVATAMPELLPFNKIVRIAESPEDFILKVKEAFDDYSPEIIKTRVSVARQHTWDQRFEEMCQILDRCLSDRVGIKINSRKDNTL